MKKSRNPAVLPYLTLGLGGIGIVLRTWLFHTGLDGKGLLLTGHPAHILIWVLTVGAIILHIYCACSVENHDSYTANFPASLPGFVGYCIAAAGIFFTALLDLLDRPAILSIVADLVGVFSCPALLAAGYCRLKRRRPSFLLHGLICLYFALRLLCQYRLWSSEPQLQNYGFQLFACVGLMLTAYHRTAFDLNMGNRKFYVFLNLSTIFCCCLSLPGCEHKFFYLAVGIWLFTNLCSMTPAMSPGSEDSES